VRRAVILADVGLELDDPPDPEAPAIDSRPDEARSEQRPGSVEGRAGDEGGDPGQRNVT
jgi:hypothetical protein